MITISTLSTKKRDAKVGLWLPTAGELVYSVSPTLIHHRITSFHTIKSNDTSHQPPTQSNYGGHRQSGYNDDRPKSDWRETVRIDRSQSERPKWCLTCYGHEREKDNDVSGDISPEEVRWANMQAAASGVSTRQLVTEFRAAEKAKVEQFQSLQRAHKPPSYRGNHIPPPSSSISGVSLQPGAPSQQQPLAQAPLSGGFGFRAPAAPGGGFGSSPFGQGPPPPPPAMSTSTAGFGQAFGAGTTTSPAAAPAGFGFGQTINPPPPTTTTTGGFGGTLGSTVPQTFGSQAQLGQQQPQQQQGFGSSPFGTAAAFGQQQQPPQQQQAVVVSGGFGSSAFGSIATPTAVATTGFGQQSVFGTAATTFSSNNSGMETQQPGGEMSIQQGGIEGEAHVRQSNNDDNADIWNAPTFERGKIPERPPPPQYVRY